MKTDRALPIEQITKFCQHWQIIELSLFGSILRDDFHAYSDIDILVAFAPTANRGLLDRAQMQEELEAVLNRRVDTQILSHSRLLLSHWQQIPELSLS
jgi:predicted nucleotidyltransferase